MRRIMTFVMGMVAGGLLLWGGLQYHVLHTQDGLKLVPKVNASLAKTYVDIRKFTVADWANNTDIVLALTEAGQGEMVGNAAGDALQNGLDRLLNRGEQR